MTSDSSTCLMKRRLQDLGELADHVTPKLVKAIDRYLQRYPEEQAVGQEFKQFVLAHEDCFEEPANRACHRLSMDY